MNTTKDTASSCPDMQTTLSVELRQQFRLKSTLYLNASMHGLLGGAAQDCDLEIVRMDGTPTVGQKSLLGNPLVLLDGRTDRYDLILGDLPFAMGSMTWNDKSRKINIKVRENWLIAFKSLFLLSENGYALFVVEPLFGNREWRRFAVDIADHGFFINAAFNTPEGCLRPYTTIRPALVVISRFPRQKLFVADPMDVASIQGVVERFRTNTPKFTLEEGVDVSADSFVGFGAYKCSIESQRLSRQYVTYRSYRLGDVATVGNVGKTGQSFQEQENCIYVPTIGTSPVVSSLADLSLKQQNYIQVHLNADIVLNKYAAIFFSSELGNMIRKSVYTGFIPKLVKGALSDLTLPLPALAEQKVIVHAYEQLVSLQDKIINFKTELSLNPKSAHKIQDSVTRMIQEISVLSDADQIRALARKGESKTCEFKQTLSLDTKTKTKEKYIETAALKTIAGFLNTDGGTLLVGVMDNGEICGLRDEMEKFYNGSADKFLLHFKDILKDRIGDKFYLHVNYGIVTIDESLVLRVICQQAKKPCFLDSKDFYVRTNPATDKLEGDKVYEYISGHFE